VPVSRQTRPVRTTSHPWPFTPIPTREAVPVPMARAPAMSWENPCKSVVVSR
jgi:hypothetical protein